MVYFGPMPQTGRVMDLAVASFVLGGKMSCISYDFYICQMSDLHYREKQGKGIQ